MKPAPLLALFALAACAAVPPPAPAVPTAGFDELAAVERLRIRPIALLEDSRCPASVQCVWAGQVRISAEIISPDGREVREMTLGKPIPIGSGTLTLVDVEPLKLAPGASDARAYRFTFR